MKPLVPGTDKVESDFNPFAYLQEQGQADAETAKDIPKDIRGDVYWAETSQGHKVKVWTPSEDTRKKYPRTWSYFCHGFTFGTHCLPPLGYSPFSADAVKIILADEHKLLPGQPENGFSWDATHNEEKSSGNSGQNPNPERAQLKAFLNSEAISPGCVVTWEDKEGNIEHSALLKDFNQARGARTPGGTILNSKNGSKELNQLHLSGVSATYAKGNPPLTRFKFWTCCMALNKEQASSGGGCSIS